MSHISPQLRDELAREGGEVIDNFLGELYAYDMEAHQRLPRKDTAFGGYPQWNYQERDELPPRCAHPECTLPRTYINRLGGFIREKLFGPDEIGQILREHNLLDTDGP